MRDLPARTVRANNILKALMAVKQPVRLSLCLMLLPNQSTHASPEISPSRTFPDHLCSLKHLTSITLLIDEPKTSSYLLECSAKASLGMVARCLESIALSSAPVHTMVAGGLRYLNSADLSRGLQLMAIHKHSLKSLHLVRLENLTGSDLILLTSSAPERTSWSGQEADDASLERVTSSSLQSSMPSDSGLEPLAAHIQQISHVRRSREILSQGSGSSAGAQNGSYCVAHNLTAFSLLECSNVTDQELAEFFTHTKNLEFVSLVPDDHVTSVGMSSAHHAVAVPVEDPLSQNRTEMLMPILVPTQFVRGNVGSVLLVPEHVQIGVESLTALAAASPSTLKHLYLSEELSPSTFGDAALTPILSVATGLEELCLNIPVSDAVLSLLAQHCKRLQKLTLPAANVSDAALAPVFEACSQLHSVTLCGSPYFGSRGIDGGFLKPLFAHSKSLTSIVLDCMHNLTAHTLCSMLLIHSQSGMKPPSSTRSSHISVPQWSGGGPSQQATIESLEELLQAADGSDRHAGQLEILQLSGAYHAARHDSSEASLAAAIAGFASLDPSAAAQSSTGAANWNNVQRCHSSPGLPAREHISTPNPWWADVASNDARSSAGSDVPNDGAYSSSQFGVLNQIAESSNGQHAAAASPPPVAPITPEQSEPEASSSAPAGFTSRLPSRQVEAAGSPLVNFADGAEESMMNTSVAAVPVGECLLESLTTLTLDHMPRLREGGSESLCVLLAHAPNLINLSLQGYDGLIDLLLEDAVQLCPRLESVSLRGCRNLSDRGLLQLCRLAPQLRTLNMQSCVMATPDAIEKVLLHHQDSLENVDLWGTRACGDKTSAFLASGSLRKVNIGGAFLGEGSQHEGLLRHVMTEIPAASGTEVTTVCQSPLLSHRVMFAPSFHEVLSMSSLVDI